MPVVTVNFVTIVIAAVASMVISMLWYSDVLFGKMWRTALGVSEKEAQAMMKKGMGAMKAQMLFSFVATLVMVYVLKHILVFAGAITVTDALLSAFWVWLGFYATSVLNGVLWEKKPWNWFYVTVGHNLVVLLVTATILVMWP